MFTANKTKIDNANDTTVENINLYQLGGYLAGLGIKDTSGNNISFQGNSGVNFHRFKIFKDLSTSISSQIESARSAFLVTSAVTAQADLIVGSGTTQPTRGDYKLENQITSLDHVAVSVDYSNSGTMLTRTFRNNSASAITVAEAGILIRFTENSIPSSPWLYSRCVLETPITVEPGCMFTVVMEI